MTEYQIVLEIAAHIWLNPKYANVEMNVHVVQTIAHLLLTEAHAQGVTLTDTEKGK